MKVIREQGMPSYRHHDFGNLYLLFSVQFPKRIAGPDGGSMTPQQVAALESVLPPRMQGPQPPPDAMVDDFNVDDVDLTREGPRLGATMEDDEDEMGGHGERVQCASQ